MPVFRKKTARPVRTPASPSAKRGTERRPIRKAASPYDKDLIQFINMLRNLGDSATDASKSLESIRKDIEAGDAESVLSRIDVLDEEIAYNIGEAVKTLLDEKGGDGIGDLLNRIRDETDATGTGHEEESDDDIEAAAKSRFAKRTTRPGQRRAIRKAGSYDVDAVLNGYIMAALWSSTDESDESGGEPMDTNYTAADIAPNTKAKMKSNVEQFLEQAGDLLEKADEQRPDYIGHNFWLSHNGHGAGFFDSPDMWGGDENTDAIEAIVDKFPELELYIGDDGKVYGGGAE